MEIERFAERWTHGPTTALPKHLALVPGLYQLKMGDKGKGWGLLGLETAALIAGIAYRSDSNQWYDTYNNLPAGLNEERYEFYFDGAQNRRNWSNRFFWLAGALYTYNLIDVLWLDQGQGMHMRRAPLPFSMGVDREGRPALQMVYRF